MRHRTSRTWSLRNLAVLFRLADLTSFRASINSTTNPTYILSAYDRPVPPPIKVASAQGTVCQLHLKNTYKLAIAHAETAST